MKNLLKKTLSILTVLAMLLCIVSAFAEEAGETEEKNLPTFEVGSAMSGKLQQDPATEIKVHAGRRGDVLFILTLAEDCEPGVIYDGGGVFLMRADEKLPIYTFVKHLQWDEYHVISLTAARNTAFSISAELIPEEPAPEAEQEAPAAEPEQAPAADQSDDAAPEVNPEPEQEEKKEEQQEEITQEEPQTQEEGQQEPQEDNKEEQEQVTGEEPQTESQEIVEGESAEGEPKEEAETPVADPAPEAGDTEQPEEAVQPETTDDTNEPDQPAAEDGQSDDQTLNPEDQTTNPEDDQEGADKPEGAADSVEIIIAATLTPDQSWSGTARKTKPTILKLDVAEARTIHMLVEGKDTLYSVQKSDRVTEDAGYVLTDAETNRSVTSFSAEAGSYLISLLAGENSLGARITVTFMNDEQFEAWEAEQEALAAEQQEETGETEEGEEQGEVEKGEIKEGEPEETEPELDTAPEGGNEENEPESEATEEREIDFDFFWDSDNPKIGDTAHFKAILKGYEEADYTLQWQFSPDSRVWNDYPGGTTETIDVVITEEINDYYWRLVVYVEDPQEE